MHEEAMLRDLVRKAEAVSREQGGSRVTRVRLWVGARSHLAGPELGARWEHAVAGTPLAAARVEIEVSEDVGNPHAERVVLRSLEVASAEELE